MLVLYWLCTIVDDEIIVKQTSTEGNIKHLMLFSYPHKQNLEDVYRSLTLGWLVFVLSRFFQRFWWIKKTLCTHGHHKMFLSTDVADIFMRGLIDRLQICIPLNVHLHQWRGDLLPLGCDQFVDLTCPFLHTPLVLPLSSFPLETEHSEFLLSVFLFVCQKACSVPQFFIRSIIFNQSSSSCAGDLGGVECFYTNSSICDWVKVNYCYIVLLLYICLKCSSFLDDSW